MVSALPEWNQSQKVFVIRISGLSFGSGGIGKHLGGNDAKNPHDIKTSSESVAAFVMGYKLS